MFRLLVKLCVQPTLDRHDKYINSILLWCGNLTCTNSIKGSSLSDSQEWDHSYSINVRQ